MAVQRRPDAEPTSTLDAALAAGKRGWRVHPLYEPVLDGFCSCGDPGCESVGKHPRLSGWPQKATTDPDRIRELWEKWPTANIGIATGPGSGLVVLDVDPRDGGDESLAELEREHGPLPETYRVGTGGGGEHYYFACDDAEIRNLSGTLGPGLDLRGEGGYVIGAGSLHAVGRRLRSRRRRGGHAAGGDAA